MKTTSAINRIQKATGWSMTQNGNVFTLEKDNVVIEVHDQEGKCLFIVVRRSSDKNDSMTDYVAGGMYYTIKGAIARFDYLVS